jgi:hypothetical protein
MLQAGGSSQRSKKIVSEVDAEKIQQGSKEEVFGSDLKISKPRCWTTSFFSALSCSETWPL